MASLKGLRILNLAENDLSGEIPSELGSLRGLWTLYLGGNQFTVVHTRWLEVNS